MKQIKLFIIIFSVVLLKPKFIFSQTQDSAKTIVGKEVVVSASKFQEPKSEIPNQVTVVTKAELQQSNSQTTADALSNLGGVFIQKSQGGGGSTILRGFEANKTLLVVDNVRMNNAIFRGGHLQNVLRVDNSALERMEVIFGSGATVYGSDALGGVMNFQTKEPKFGGIGKTNFKLNTFERFSSANSEKTGNVDINLGWENFASYTSFTYSDFGDATQGKSDIVMIDTKDSIGKITGSFPAFDRKLYVERIDGKDSVITNANPEKQVGTAYSQYNILQKFKLLQGENVEHNLAIHFTNTSDVPRYDRLTEVASGKPRFAEWYYGPEKWLMINYSLNLMQGGFYDNLKTTLAYQKFGESRNSRRLNAAARKSQMEDVSVYSLNVDAVKVFGINNLKYGIEANFNDVKSTATFTDITKNDSVYSADTRYPDGGSQTNTLSAYVTDKIGLFEGLIINAGARFNMNSLTVKFIDKTFFPFPYDEAKQDNKSISGNLGVVYSPNDMIRISALGATGYRTPNVDDLTKVFESTKGTLIIPNPDLKPETTLNGELSLDLNFEFVKLNATVYNTMLSDAITTEPTKFNGQDSVNYNGTMSHVVTSVNKTEATVNGLSLGLYAPLFSGLSFRGNLNMIKGRIKEAGDSTSPLDHIPPTYGKASLIYDNNGIIAEFYTIFNGEKKLEDYKIDGEDNLQYATPEGMPAWTTLNIKCGYKLNSNLTLQAGIENLLDKNYRTFASGYSALGRNIIIAIRAGF